MNVNREAATGYPHIVAAPAGHHEGMATTGPKHYREATQLYDRAKGENNPTEKTHLLAMANYNMQAAILTAIVHSGGLEKDVLKEWQSWGIRVR